MVLNGEVGGDQRWDLTSDICGVDLRAVFGLVVLNHLGLQNTPVLCSVLTDAASEVGASVRGGLLLHSRCWGWSLGPVSSEVVLPVLQVLQEKPLASPAGARSWAPQTALFRRAERVLVDGLVQMQHWFRSASHCRSYLLVGGIQVEQQQHRDRAAGNHQGLEERARGRDYPCPPWEGPPWEGPPWEGPSSVLLAGPPLAG